MGVYGVLVTSCGFNYTRGIEELPLSKGELMLEEPSEMPKPQ